MTPFSISTITISYNFNPLRSRRPPFNFKPLLGIFVQFNYSRLSAILRECLVHMGAFVMCLSIIPSAT